MQTFCQGLCDFPYLCQSPEIQAFLRPEKSVEKSLAALAKPKSTDIMAMYQSCLPKIDTEFDEAELKMH